MHGVDVPNRGDEAVPRLVGHQDRRRLVQPVARNPHEGDRQHQGPNGDRARRASGDPEDQVAHDTCTCSTSRSMISRSTAGLNLRANNLLDVTSSSKSDARQV